MKQRLSCLRVRYSCILGFLIAGALLLILGIASYFFTPPIITSIVHKVRLRVIIHLQNCFYFQPRLFTNVLLFCLEPLLGARNNRIRHVGKPARHSVHGIPRVRFGERRRNTLQSLQSPTTCRARAIHLDSGAPTCEHRRVSSELIHHLQTAPRIH